MGTENCILCQIVAGKIPSKKVYEDDEVVAILDVNGASIGHCFVMPKEHFAIFEQVPDSLVGKLFKVANAVSSAIFETLNVQGTNIFVSNGTSAGQTVAHFMINVIPRKEGDGINLQWQPKQVSQEELTSIESRLKEQTAGGVQAQTEKAEENPVPAEKEPEVISGEENYLVKQLRRIP